jgi:hypothetical protein
MMLAELPGLVVLVRMENGALLEPALLVPGLLVLLLVESTLLAALASLASV